MCLNLNYAVILNIVAWANLFKQIMIFVFFDFQEIPNFIIKLILEPNLPYHINFVEKLSFMH